MNKKVLYSLLALTAASISASASASLITNLDLTAASPFGGFDYSQNGTAISTPGPSYKDGDTVTTYYFADAVAINKTGGGIFATPNLLSSAPGTSFAVGQYEYTITAQINEVISGCGGPCAGAATFTPTGGTFNIYYDSFGLAGGNTVANQVTGTGFTDGALLLSGNVSPGGGGTFDPTTGTGIFSFSGQVLTTNSTYITPDQTNQFDIATLQFGSSTTNWTAATASPFGALPGSNIQFQADGNQNFTVAAIPEPGSLALIGISMMGLFAARKRYKSS
ncbi:MAG: flocculation-associated PEP-CTERM protein PepA [Nitrosospira sp.]